jgi:pimeloyl-ACP methyl ester carboxylesterase
MQMEDGTDLRRDRAVANVAIVGAGIMGSGIAQVVAGAGLEVTLVDLDASDDGSDRGGPRHPDLRRGLGFGPRAGPALREADDRLPQVASLIQANRDAEPELAPVEQPTLVLWGARDRTHARTDRHSSLELAPDARYFEFADSGHSPDLEEEERFAGLALALVDEAS